MQFITQGKINLKYILIVVMLAAIVGGGILGYQRWSEQREVETPKGKDIISSSEKTEEERSEEEVPILTVGSDKILLILAKVPTDYKVFRDRYVALNSLDITTGQKVELTRWSACEATVVLSSDKSKMVYFMTPNDQCEREYYQAGSGKTEMWVSDLFNQNKQLITDGVWKYTPPKWTLDGKHLAYEKVVEHPYPQEREHKLFLYNLQNKQERFLGSFFGAAHEIIGFSQNNDFIYYKGKLDELFKINVTNQNRVKIYTPEPGFVSIFAVSPDRSRIAVFNMEGWYGGKATPTRWKIGVIDVSTDSYREFYNGTDPLTLLPYHKGGTIVFSKDSSYVIYGITSKGSDGGLWTIDLITGNRKKIEGTSALSGIAPITLSTDGNLLLYTDFEPNNRYYYVLSLSAGVIREITNIDTSSGEAPVDWLNQ